jgi:hypothetical protein
LAPGAPPVVETAYNIGKLLFPAVPVKISLATVAPAASLAGNAWLLSHPSILGAVDSAWLNVILNTFWALLLPAPVAFAGMAILFIF